MKELFLEPDTAGAEDVNEKEAAKFDSMPYASYI